MKQEHLRYGLSILFILLLFSCGQKSGSADISEDSTRIAQGREIFLQQCSACHDFRQDGIGPHLGGVTSRASADWLRAFIRDPRGLMDDGDERSNMLLARYKTVMPSFDHLSADEVENLLAYMHTQETPPERQRAGHGPALEDPLPEPIAMSDIVVEIEHVVDMPASATQGIKTRITKLGFIPGSDRHFMVDIRGLLYELVNDKAEVYLDIRKHKPDFIDKPGLATGFGSFAFHPEFLENGLFYTGHTESVVAQADFAYADSVPVLMQWVASEWVAEDPNEFPFRGTSRELFRINMVSGAHGVQEFAFNPYARKGEGDYGLLYIGIGDGSSVQLGYPYVTGGRDRALGSIFRIDPQGKNSRNGNYGIPASNPFAQSSDTSVVKEIYAYGFRNPHRLSWTQEGYLLASNIGQTNIESIYLVEPGKDYGWPSREGTFLFDPYGDLNKIYPLPDDEATYDFNYPLTQYDHDEGVAVIGGFVYTGTQVPVMRGKYLFGDMNFGRLFYIHTDEIRPGNRATIYEWQISYEGRIVTTRQLCGNRRVDLRLGQDSQGEFYLFSKQDGRVYRLKRAVQASGV